MLLNLQARNLSTIIEKFIYICSYYYTSKCFTRLAISNYIFLTSNYI